VRGTRATIIGYSEVGQKEAIAGDLESGSEAGALSIINGRYFVKVKIRASRQAEPAVSWPAGPPTPMQGERSRGQRNPPVGKR
jgi:hypothetical protein